MHDYNHWNQLYQYLKIEVFIRSKSLRVVVIGGVAVVVDFGGCKDSIRLPTVKKKVHNR